ncbi:response regulator transcription factor [Desulfitobacterium sp.]|uniref:response regulator transcription factor n=1 Tax=Desulfitobacterium sp. TaxID=49981 RepID=UPI002B2016F8|nr:response regulator transcription factor [Desulfitobacterium sp.]MEA4902625.1 response regulator transcription factor [Desulfitobacterium sp.]
MEQPTIVVIDDDDAIKNLIGIYLQNEGFQVIKAGDGLEALEILANAQVHLIILDIMMPKMDGIEACLKIRAERDVPIIMLSAKTEDMDKIHGLSVGADDYMTKPFNPLELVARVKSQLRRYLRFTHADESDINPSELEVGNLRINTSTHQVLVKQREIKLTPKEFAILELLARNRGMVFSGDRIYELVWQEPMLESENTVMVHIRNIREKIEDNPRKPRYIKNVWGVGYKLD